MVFVETRLKTLGDKITAGNNVILFSGYDETIKVQIIAEYAIVQEHGLSQWNYSGWTQEMEVSTDEDGEFSLKEVEQEHNTKDPIEALGEVENKTGEKEIVIVDLIHESNLDEKVLSAISDVATKLKGTNVVMMVNFHSNDNNTDYVDNADIQNLLSMDNVDYMNNDYPTYDERVDAITDLFTQLLMIKPTSEFIGEDGEKTMINMEFPVDNVAVIESLAKATDGLTTKQMSTCLGLSVISNKGNVVVADVEREAAYHRDMNKGVVPKDFFMDRILNAQNRNEWVGEENYYGYVFRVFSEYVYSRHASIHLITGDEDSGNILLDKATGLFGTFYGDKAKSVIVYNCRTEQVEKIESNLQNNTEEGEADEDDSPSKDEFSSLKALMANQKKISVLEILRWFKQPGDDKFVLLMKNLDPTDMEGESLMRYVIDVDHVSRKNIISTHPTDIPVKFYHGDSYVVLYLEE